MPPTRFRDEDRPARLKGGKPVRSGASINAPTIARVPAGGAAVRIVGRMKPTGSYDPWFIYKWYVDNGYQFVYSPAIDFD